MYNRRGTEVTISGRLVARAGASLETRLLPERVPDEEWPSPRGLDSGLPGSICHRGPFQPQYSERSFSWALLPKLGLAATVATRPQRWISLSPWSSRRRALFS